MSAVPALAAVLALAAVAPVSAATSWECRLPSVCMFEQSCAMLDAPIPLTVRANGTSDGIVVLDGREGTLRHLGTSGGTHTWLAKIYRDALSLLTVYEKGTVIVSTHDLYRPSTTAVLSGRCEGI